MALIRPAWPLDASFQFSFFVLLGILLLSGACLSALNRFMPWMRRYPQAAETLAVSFSAQAAALPIQLLFYGYVPLLALAVNGFAGGLMSLLMLGGIFCMAVGAGLPTVGRWLGAAVGAVSGAAQRLILGVAGLEIKICRLPAPYGWALPVAIAAMMLCSRRIRFGRGRRRALAATLCILLIGYLPRFAPDARYVQLDVGQGDAAVLRHGRQATLVDVGPAGCYDVLRYLRREGLYVDALILSHLDEDHAGALGALLASEEIVHSYPHCWSRRAYRNPTHLRRCGRRLSWRTKGAFQSKRRPPGRKLFRAALRLTCSRRRMGWRATTSVRWCCIRSPWARGF